MKKILILLFFLITIYVQINSNPTDDKIEEFNKKKVTVYHKQYFDIQEEKAVKQFYGDVVRFDLFRGDGTKVKLSTIVKEMGNNYLYKNLLWGESYYGFVSGLIVSIVIGSIMDVVGLGLTLFQEKIYTNKGNPFDDNPNLITGISLLGASIIPITGIFIFSFFMYKAYPYNFNIIQTQTIVNQYNEFLRKKLGIEGDILYNYSDSEIYFCFKFKF